MMTINGNLFKDMFISAAAAVENNKEAINDLNVFPVPDGDTGTNMSMTLSAAANRISSLSNPGLGEVLRAISEALLRGARGNSGVITSLLFRGFTKSSENLTEMDGPALAAALSDGSSSAYKAVMKPAEGTILTVSRACADAALKSARKNKEPEKVMLAAVEAARTALDNTVNQNPVLKKAGVVDAGGYGWLIILDAMYGVLTGTKSVKDDFVPRKTTASVANFAIFDTEDINFAYCTEFIAERSNKKRDPDKLKAFLETIGDCVVVVSDDEIVKIHVHTNNPDRALAEGLKFGTLSAIKIENMQEQHNRLADSAPTQKSVKPEKPFGFVSVAAGEGISDLFKDMGADVIVSGGQTMNPSTEDILGAVMNTPAETVFVLPNNKNIIMAAEQAAPLADRKVIVIPSKTIPQGLSAIMYFDPDACTDDNAAAMNGAMENVTSGSITYAARDSEFDGMKIAEGDYLTLLEGKLKANDSDFEAAAEPLIAAMCEKNPEFITVICGEGSSEEHTGIIRRLFEKLAPEAEMSFIEGGQPVYSYIISAE